MSSTVLCAICGHTRRGKAEPVYLTHGVVVHLCPTHRAPAYMMREGGQVFAGRLEDLWRAHGAATRQRLAALRAHRRQCLPAEEGLPGSYAWPDLRRDAERRYAAGECPDDVIRSLREAHSTGHARVPSPRTMRRWFHEGRWRHPEPARPTARRRLPRILPGGMIEDTAYPILAGLIFEDPKPTLSETAGLGRRPRPRQRE